MRWPRRQSCVVRLRLPAFCASLPFKNLPLSSPTTKRCYKKNKMSGWRWRGRGTSAPIKGLETKNPQNLSFLKIFVDFIDLLPRRLLLTCQNLPPFILLCTVTCTPFLPSRSPVFPTPGEYSESTRQSRRASRSRCGARSRRERAKRQASQRPGANSFCPNPEPRNVFFASELKHNAL
jgi:hypothetical protein